MRFLGSYSADMYDLTKETERQRFLLFGNQFLKGIGEAVATSREYPPIQFTSFRYEPHDQPQPSADQGDKKVLILTDCLPGQTNLAHMVVRLKGCFRKAPRVVNLFDIEMKGGCLGCIRCGYDNTCVYEGKDGFINFFKETVTQADVIVFAGAIRDRYLSSRWKMFFDRSFFNNHVPSLTGKQVGFLISGSLGQIPNLRQIFEAYVELQKGNLVGIITDEHDQSSEIDSLIEGFASGLVEYATIGYIKPETFFGTGGRKIFRDEIFGNMRFPFQADHAYYKKHGFYDFPQKDLKKRLTSTFLMLLTKIPAMRKEIYNKRMVEEMVKPLKKVVDKAA